MWYESGGEGSRTALLLHGLGATAAVWKPVERALQERGSVRWLAADLSGHGGSDWQSSYSVGQLAAQLAELVQQQMIGEFFVVGHSLGGYRRVSGLGTDIAPGEEWLARGSVHAERGWRLAQDPRTFAVAGAPFASLVASATVPVLLARGERDPMVSLRELRMHAPQACDIPGAGHNAHIEDPGAVVGLLEHLVARV